MTRWSSLRCYSTFSRASSRPQCKCVAIFHLLHLFLKQGPVQRRVVISPSPTYYCLRTNSRCAHKTTRCHESNVFGAHARAVATNAHAHAGNQQLVECNACKECKKRARVWCALSPVIGVRTWNAAATAPSAHTHALSRGLSPRSSILVTHSLLRPPPRRPHLPSSPPPFSPSNMRCVHCHTTETPLWRAGPAGPKTLCNACGVRWKKTGSLIARSKRAPPSDVSTAFRKRSRTVDTCVPSSTSAAITATTVSPTAPSCPPPASSHAPHAAPPAPRPASVFRAADATRARYDSVFSGLMVVHRGALAAPPARRARAPAPSSSPPSATTTATATTVPSRTPSASPAPTGACELAPDAPDGGGDGEPFAPPVFVTETHAPSPSPSPPPIPRVQRAARGEGFRLCLSVGPHDAHNAL
eukprot:gb/GEZJ01006010.1/.p1 GENE.gb/GEZJ01006010.1/~~gb/GEZJ01006010.1/.p1  ORF type:complete len:414 (+),score=18.87 gb/GEZJ01006010.1/:620-1861(+)